MSEPTGIPEEEWGLLAQALAGPVRQMIAVEAVDSAQMAEVERRLTDLAGARPVSRLVAGPAVDAPDDLWRQARQRIPPESAPDAPPLLLVEIDAPPPADALSRQRLAEFWRGMNQLREQWHDLPAQTIFLLSPAAYQHLSLHADHLKRWIALSIRLWHGAHDLEVLERPGRAELAHATFPSGEADDTQDRRERQRLALLARQYKQALDLGTSGPALLRRYLLPLIQGHLALGDLEGARTCRQRVEPVWELEPSDREALALLDEQLDADAGASPAFDVFLSHNSRDKPVVRALAGELRERGLTVWLDEDELRPGLNWQSLIESGIRQSASVVVLIGKDGLGPWENEEMQGALIHAVKDGRPVIPVLLPDAPRQPELPLFLKTRSWVDLRPAPTEDNLGRLIWGITGRKPERPIPSPRRSGHATEPRLSVPSERDREPRTHTNPFDPWTPVTPPRFFGRDRLLRRLGDALDQGRSVSLVGDSRIGKSSLLETWAIEARKRGRQVVLISGEGVEATSCQALVEKITGKAIQADGADLAADELSRWACAATLPPLVLVDEAERVLAHLPHRFFERLRGMLGRLCWVLASRKEIGDIPRDDHLTSPLLNRLELQRLGLLEPEAVGCLIALGAGMLRPEDGDLMRDWAGRHPFYLCLLGHYLWNAHRDGEPTAEALETFQENAFPRLEESWRMLTAREQQRLADALRLGSIEADNTLKRHGLLDDGRPLGRVLITWLAQR